LSRDKRTRTVSGKERFAVKKFLLMLALVGLIGVTVVGCGTTPSPTKKDTPTPSPKDTTPPKDTPPIKKDEVKKDDVKKDDVK